MVFGIRKPDSAYDCYLFILDIKSLGKRHMAITDTPSPSLAQYTKTASRQCRCHLDERIDAPDASLGTSHGIRMEERSISCDG